MGWMAALIPAAAGMAEKQQEQYKTQPLSGDAGGQGQGAAPSAADPFGQAGGGPGSTMGPPGGGGGTEGINPFSLGTVGDRLGLAGQDRSFGQSLMGGELPQGRMAGQVYIPPGPGEMALSILPKVLGWKMMQNARDQETGLLDKRDRERGPIYEHERKLKLEDEDRSFDRQKELARILRLQNQDPSAVPPQGEYDADSFAIWGD